MIMTAVRLAPQNFSLITNAIPTISWGQLKDMYERSTFIPEPTYVVTHPDPKKPEEDIVGFTFEDLLQSTCNYDHDSINTKFTPIVYK